ncbi:unnamed protein product [Polarella glacialis]|uniref:Uncharacterized protein n=1 Tax=Polarella glacialis TaxID=89957 RepID=A0A813JIP6_POLGL|nr:unnamed protein product [Polarella glacialis]
MSRRRSGVGGKRRSGVGGNCPPDGQDVLTPKGGQPGCLLTLDLARLNLLAASEEPELHGVPVMLEADSPISAGTPPNSPRIGSTVRSRSRARGPTGAAKDLAAGLTAALQREATASKQEAALRKSVSALQVFRNQQAAQRGAANNAGRQGWMTPTGSQGSARRDGTGSDGLPRTPPTSPVRKRTRKRNRNKAAAPLWQPGAVSPRGATSEAGTAASRRNSLSGLVEEEEVGHVNGYVSALEAALKSAATSNSNDLTTPPNSVDSPGSRQAKPFDWTECVRRMTTHLSSCSDDDRWHDCDGSSDDASQGRVLQSGARPEADLLAEAAPDLPEARTVGRGEQLDGSSETSWVTLALEAAALAEVAQMSAVRAAQALAAAAAAAAAAGLDSSAAAAQADLEAGSTALAEAARASAGARAKAATHASAGTVAALLRVTSAVQDQLKEKTSSPLPVERPELGDVIILGERAPADQRGAAAVVTKVAEAHCTVIVLDASRRFGAGECWPSFEHLAIESRDGRLGSRVLISGMTGSKTSKLNGFSGTICLHKREGHPTFIRKPSAPDVPLLTFCVRLDEPELAGEKIVLLEPRFLTPQPVR